LLIKQLLQNSKQYGQTKISIKLSQDKLEISNDQATNQHKVSNKEFKTYGYGVGLQMITNICERLTWQHLIKQNSTQYTTTLKFNDK
jgi:hypothetical protein